MLAECDEYDSDELNLSSRRECELYRERQNACILEDSGVLVSLEILWLVCWVASSIPLYMMCCCSEPPHLVMFSLPLFTQKHVSELCES